MNVYFSKHCQKSVNRFETLAKVIDITEHSDELAHGDLRRVQAEV